jgi:signal transduction histidine kinase/CheY-like chemotaxis protein
VRRALTRYILFPPQEALREEHRRTVLYRSWVSALIALVVMPFTILTFVAREQPRSLEPALLISALSCAGALAVLLLLRRRAFDRTPHLPFVLLVLCVCYPTEAVVLQLTGGGARSDFLFPYFVVLFGMATLYPSRFGWALAVAAGAPLSYVASELLAGRDVGEGRAFSQLILLLDAGLICAFANRVTTRIFFSEAGSRLALQEANARLLEVDRLKSEFFAGLSHDLRSPLTVILAPLWSLKAQGKGLTPSERRCVELALGGAARLDAMINDLLDLARIESGVRELHRSRLDVARMVRELCEASQPYARSLGLELRCEAPAHPVPMAADPDRLDRVVMNLLSNALKFSQAGTSVVLSLEEGPTEVRVSVADQGRGIPPEDLPNIFGRFARASNARDGRTPGAGLGLAVVKEFVELHGGSVSVESAPGVGSTFRVRLPRALETLPPEPPADAPLVLRSRAPRALLLPTPAAPGAGAAGRPRLLLVEDTRELRAFLASELSDAFSVEEAEDGEGALARVRQSPPEVVLTDVMLPGLDGLSLCRALREGPATRRLPVVVFSARGNLETRLEAFAAGADDFLPKPFDPQELRARLHSVLRRASAA